MFACCGSVLALCALLVFFGCAISLLALCALVFAAVVFAVVGRWGFAVFAVVGRAGVVAAVRCCWSLGCSLFSLLLVAGFAVCFAEVYACST